MPDDRLVQFTRALVNNLNYASYYPVNNLLGLRVESDVEFMGYGNRTISLANIIYFSFSNCHVFSEQQKIDLAIWIESYFRDDSRVHFGVYKTPFFLSFDEMANLIAGLANSLANLKQFQHLSPRYVEDYRIENEPNTYIAGQYIKRQELFDAVIGKFTPRSQMPRYSMRPI